MMIDIGSRLAADPVSEGLAPARERAENLTKQIGDLKWPS